MSQPSIAIRAAVESSKAPLFRAWTHWFAAAVALWLAIAALPVIPGFSMTGLESWVLALSMAHGQGLVHGKDIIWTYGPLAYLSLPCFPGGQPNLVMVYHLGLYLVGALGLIRLAISTRNRAPVWSVFLIGIVAVLEPTFVGDHLELAIFTWAALALVDDDRFRFLETILLAFLAAIALLVKVSLGVQAAATFLCILATLWPKQSKARLAAAVACLPVFTFVLYGASTGSPGAFFAYLRYALNISSGYSDSMGMPGPLWQAVTAVISLMLLFLILPLLARPIRELAPAFAPALVSAFFLFKSAFVRQDAHAAAFQIKLLLASVFFLIIAGTLRYRLALMVLQMVSLVTGYVVISQAWPQLMPSMERRLILRVDAPIQWLMHPGRTWRGLQRQAEAELSTFQLGQDFAAAIGGATVDVLPWDVSLIEANHWKWQPRPVFQSYAAYTPVLDRTNAEHFQGSGAADFLLTRWGAIDNRHPFFEDPLSWRAVLDRYESTISDGQTLLLKRAPNHRFAGPEPAGSSVAHWNESVPVPQGRAPLVLSAGVRKSLFGGILSFGYRLSSVWISITRQSGRTERYRAVPPNLASGIIINPLPENLAELNLVGQRNCVPGDPVVALKFISTRPAEFGSDIPLQWSYLPTQNGSTKPGPCLLAEASPGDFPSWGGTGTVTITAGEGILWHADSASNWITTVPGRPESMAVNFSVAGNAGGAAREGSITVNGMKVPIRQSGIYRESARSIELGLYHAGSEKVETPSGIPDFKIVGDRVNTFGILGDQPVMGDWTGTGVIRIGVFRNGLWYLDLNNNRRWDGVDGGDAVYSFGLPGDQAVAGDWNGDGIAKLGVFRAGMWVLDVNNNHKFDPSDPLCHFGNPGDLAAVGKWKTGSRADQIGVFRKGAWIVDSNGDREFELSDARFQFGLDGDLPVVSLSRNHIGVFRKGVWILDTKGNREFDLTAIRILYGLPGARPLIGEW
jgi:hypothetical protein